MKKNEKSLPWFIAGILFFLLIWELCSRFFNSTLIFPGPVPVLAELVQLAGNEKFLSSLAGTFARVMGGMIISVPAGLVFGIAAGLDKRTEAFLRPLFQVISATPVMSVILIAFLFLGAEKTPVFTAFLMIFPVMAANSSEGIRRVDPRLAELFRVYKMTPKETLFCLYIPSMAPHILSGVKSSLSLCWKVIVAAEILVQPFRSLGTGMQQARARLETPQLFAWTVVTVVSAALLQGLLNLIIRLLVKKGSRK